MRWARAGGAERALGATGVVVVTIGLAVVLRDPAIAPRLAVTGTALPGLALAASVLTRRAAVAVLGAFGAAAVSLAAGAGALALGVLGTGVLLVLGAIGDDAGARVGPRLALAVLVGAAGTAAAVLALAIVDGRRTPAATAVVAAAAVVVLAVVAARRARARATRPRHEASR